ncbi:MAG: ABC transporter ATP-binding protein [Proteobacteria bacterium]|nr:ABC transporter ATP-binding protein [Pseudomonadota bacterium]
MSNAPEADLNTKSISIRNIGVTFKSEASDAVEALCPIDLEIPAGEFVALVGPSGCGKSTLLNVLAGFIPPSVGTALVGDDKISKPDIDHGMVFQDYALFPWLNVLDNVAFGLERQGVGRDEREARALENLDLVGLKDFAGKRVHELSGGMKQRVAIARVFATDPSIILMDEPFGALDALTRRFLQHQLLAIWQRNRKTVVFVTHSVQEAVYLASRAIVMTARPGRIKLDQKIELAHPRDFSAADFRAYEKLIYDQLDEELAKTFNLEGSGGTFRD